MRIDPGSKPKPSSNVSISDAAVGGDFKLFDTSGNEVTQESLKGKISLMYFGYGHCPDTCPAALHNITEALNMLQPAELSSLQIFFITLDPERDNASYLKKFISGFHSKIIALIGSPEEIAKISKEYKVYSSKGASSGGEYLIDHSSLIYLMGKDGKYILHLSSSTPPTEISTELKKLLTSN